MDAVQGLTLSTAREDEKVVIYVCGELDFATAPRLQPVVDAALEDGAVECALDCQGVTFIDSEAFKSIIRLQKSAAQCGTILYLRNNSRQVSRTLALLGLENYLAPCCGS